MSKMYNFTVKLIYINIVSKKRNIRFLNKIIINHFWKSKLFFQICHLTATWSPAQPDWPKAQSKSSFLANWVSVDSMVRQQKWTTSNRLCTKYTYAELCKNALHSVAFRSQVRKNVVAYKIRWDTQGLTIQSRQEVVF